jgi:hypothetical protein
VSAITIAACLGGPWREGIAWHCKCPLPYRKRTTAKTKRPAPVAKREPATFLMSSAEHQDVDT